MTILGCYECNRSTSGDCGRHGSFVAVPDPNWRDSESARLILQLHDRDAEIARLRDLLDERDDIADRLRAEVEATMRGQEALREQAVRIRRAAGVEPNTEGDTETHVARLRAEVVELEAALDLQREVIRVAVEGENDARAEVERLRAQVADLTALVEGFREASGLPGSVTPERLAVAVKRDQAEIARLLLDRDALSARLMESDGAVERLTNERDCADDESDRQRAMAASAMARLAESERERGALRRRLDDTNEDCADRAVQGGETCRESYQGEWCHWCLWCLRAGFVEVERERDALAIEADEARAAGAVAVDRLAAATQDRDAAHERDASTIAELRRQRDEAIEREAVARGERDAAREAIDCARDLAARWSAGRYAAQPVLAPQTAAELLVAALDGKESAK